MWIIFVWVGWCRAGCWIFSGNQRKIAVHGMLVGEKNVWICCLWCSKMMKADTQIAVMQMWIGLVLGSCVIACLGCLPARDGGHFYSISFQKISPNAKSNWLWIGWCVNRNHTPAPAHHFKLFLYIIIVILMFPLSATWFPKHSNNPHCLLHTSLINSYDFTKEHNNCRH